jgi:protein gp37
VTNIEWTDATWNPVRGCSRVSAGCDNCYAMRFAHRFSGAGEPYEGLTTIRRGKVDWSGSARFVPEMLAQPLKWRKPRRVFVNSMSDLFHESLTDGEILAVFRSMALARHHTYQVLTKRPKRMLEWARRWNDLSGETFGDFKNARGPDATRAAHPSPRGQMFASYLETLGEPPPGAAYPTFDWAEGLIGWPSFDVTWSHVWLGVSVEDQQTADERIPLLLQTPAAVRFVSAEPLLGPIHRPLRPRQVPVPNCVSWLDSRRGSDGELHSEIDWVIVGGESGAGARECEVSWIRRIVSDCQRAGVPVFVKQLGAYARDQDHFGAATERLRHRKGAEMSEWPEDLRVREVAL